MSTDPRTEPSDAALVARALAAEDVHWGYDHGFAANDRETASFAHAVLAALDLPARDARVRAEALREHAAYMREKAEGVAEDVVRRARWPWTGYLVAAKHAEMAADEIALASPSSSPVDAPSRPTGTPGPSTDGESE